MLKPQPRFSGNGGHGKRLLETEEEVFEKGLMSTGSKLLGQGKQLGRSFGMSYKRANKDGLGPKLAAPTMGNLQAGKAGSYLANNKAPLAYGAAGGGAAVGGLSLMNKAYKPSGRLVAASRQAELHAFKTAKPAPPKPKQKVWDVTKSSQQATRYGALALKAKNPKVQGRAFEGLERSLARQSKVTKREPQVWEVRNGKAKQTTMDKTKRAKQGDLVGMRAHRDQQGKRSANLAAGLAVGGLAGTAGSFIAKTPRNRIGSAVAGLGASVGSLAASRNARHHTAVEVKNLSQNKHYVVGGRKYKLDEDALERNKLNVNLPKSKKVSKKARTYDSEMNRQRRQGMYVAGGAMGAAGLGTSAARDVRGLRASGESTRQTLSRFLDPEMRLRVQNRVVGPVPNFGKPSGQSTHPKGGTVTVAERNAIEGTKDLRSRMSPTMRRKVGGKIGGAVLLGGGSAGMYKHSRSKANRRWN